MHPKLLGWIALWVTKAPDFDKEDKCMQEKDVEVVQC